jgi:muramidase (phage lysozyme)
LTRLATDKNVSAFLDMLAASEIGHKLLAESDDGYNVMVGGKLFQSYIDHPRVRVQVKPGLWSTAAGRYQLLAKWFDPYKALLKLSDFGPEAQDAIAIQQLRETKAHRLILDGDVVGAIDRCSKIWASLPGAGYGQHENRPAFLLGAYLNAGGVLS